MSYNGYKNYETWDVSLWLDNEERLYNYWLRRARNLLGANEGYEDGENYALGLLAKQIEEEIEELNPVDGNSVYSDLLTHALGVVEWREVAASFIETAKEQLEDL